MSARSGRSGAIGALLAIGVVGSPLHAQAEELYIRVVDVGNALCVIVREPGGGSLLYDAGNYAGQHCIAGLQNVIGDGQIDMVVVSHSDADHLGELDRILAAFPGRIGALVYTGREGTSERVWPRARNAIFDRQTRPDQIRTLGPVELPEWYTEQDRARVVMDPLPNAADPSTPPLAVNIGAMRVTVIAGWQEWPEREPHEASERNNIVSLVVRIDYGGKSVLLTGDTIGRLGGDPPETCMGAERWMVENTPALIDTDILIGQHHGGDNSSAICFLEAVSPRYAVLAAGHVSSYRHPRLSAIRRFTGNGIPGARMIVPGGRIFQTDRGDDQGPLEWSPQRRPGCHDLAGDDDVEIFLSDEPTRDARVRYRIALDGPCRRAPG